MNPAGKQGQNGTIGGNDGGFGGDPSGTAFGATNVGADPVVSGEDLRAADIGIDDDATRGLGPDVSESSAETGSARFGAVREGASRLRGEAADRARGYAEDGKARVTERLDGFTQSLHDIAGNLEEQVGPQLAQYAHSAADRLDEFSAALREKSVDELVDDARAFVRRSPAVAIGAAVAVGFALSRFLKASAEQPARRGGRKASTPSLSASRADGRSQPRYDA
jgi:ElaB/YqjD/DUF883 family membrane-anchored ribosome-binding protein